MKKRTLVFVLILFFAVFQSFAQPFSTVSTSIQAVGRSAVAWGDHDNDGDLDLAISGMTPGGIYRTAIYDNDEGNMVLNDATITGVKDGTIAWGDFDNDLDLDLLISGQTMESGDICMIYRNDDGVFNPIDPGLPGIGYGDASWGDFDNDGDLDILISGSWMVALYENEGSTFLLTDNDFGQLQNSKSCWGDFDNDGDLDILLMGDTGGGYLSDIFLNDQGQFERAFLDMTGVISGSADMVDFDQDGDLDISLTGYDIFLEPHFLLYENLGSNQVIPYENIMEGIATSSVDWGDYDNDGDLDILMCGKTGSCGGAVSKVYTNQDGIFLMEPGAVMEGMIRANAAWADYDNDGDLDILLSGMTAAEYPFTQLIRNEAGSNEYTPNTLPQAPQGLQSFVNGQSVILLWEQGLDAETPQDGLYYNIRVGMSSGNVEMISPLAENGTGYRYVQAIGNVNQQTSWTINGLLPGTYYWSVQTIDQAYSGSPFAVEGTFAVIATGLRENESDLGSDLFPNPASDVIFINDLKQGSYDFRIMNSSGQLMYKGNTTFGEAIDIDFLDDGLYLMQIIQGDKQAVKRFVKK